MKYHATVCLEDKASALDSAQVVIFDAGVSPNQYRLEEMKLLRSEIELQIKQINENERNCIIGVGLLIYFTASLEPPRNEVVTHIIRALPLAVALLGTLRAAGLRSSIDVMDGYLLRVEEAIDPKGEFWVKAYSKSLNGRSKLLRYWPRKLYWAALIVFGLIYYWIGSEVIGTAKSK